MKNSRIINMYQTWKKLYPFIKPYNIKIIQLTILMLLCAFIDAIIPLGSGYVIDYFIVPNQLEGIGMFAIICIFIIFIQGVLTLLMARVALKVEMYIGRDLRKAMYEHLQSLSFDYFNKTPVGTIVARLMSDTGKIGTVFAWCLIDIVWSLAFIVGSIILMCIINFQLALLILCIVPIILFTTYFFQMRLLKANRVVRENNAQITRALNEGISGAKTSKTLAIEQDNIASFKTVTNNMKQSSVRTIMLNAVFIPCVSFFTSIAICLVLVNGGYAVIFDVIAIGEFTIFINYAMNIADPVQQLAKSISTLIATQVNVERCNELLEIEQQIQDSKEVIEKYGTVFNPKVHHYEPINGDIDFKNVSFRYADGNVNVLENFNLEVKAGQTIAIVGQTGAGKSTLVNLICRFFEPTSGEIWIDGIDYRQRGLLWLHSNIGYVLQTPHLFSGTIKDNIRYGNLEASDKDIQEAAKLVNAHDFIMELELGYDSIVGEGGDGLSLGQKQLISFARAIVSNPKIFVLDEATASIDTKTEQLIQQAISNLLGTRTSFIVAHRLSTIRQADKILVVDNGKIIESGNHQELLEKQGAYASLYIKQFQEETMSILKDR
ncbi:ABC transporter ATP-binding protein [Tannockella kyphosi]|uniref:ABC transporter ATP-binding protein n=1 Tax=Tannockella kyphosi TaxID=2899121 RepID=UPI002013B673|nr:ABC transporter ATP-binding protein [Tannockella kyphosi]